MEEIIEILLGKGAIKKLNDQRKKDGYKEIDSAIALNILIGISEAYINEHTNNIMKPLENNIERVDNYNRRTRRYNNRNRGRYGRY